MKIKSTKYIGYHKGSIHDGYQHSSENDEFVNIFNQSEILEIEADEPDFYEAFVYEWIYNPIKNTMSRKILAYGGDTEMYSEESKLHELFDVKNNPDYFNLTNSPGPWKSIKIDELEVLVNDIHNGVHTKKEEENIQDLYNELIGDRIQPRRDEDNKFVMTISKDIRAAKNTSNTEPIRVVVDKNGKRKMFDGNTTLLAAHKVIKYLKPPTIKVDEIPYEIAKNFERHHFSRAGLLLNKKPKKQKRPNTAQDVAWDVFNSFQKRNVGIKSPESKKLIEAAGWGKRKGDVYKIVNNWINTGNVITATYVNYKLAPNIPKLNKVVKKYKNKNTKVFCFSSGKFHDDTLNKWLTENTNHGKKKPTKTKLKIVIYHSNQQLHISWTNQLSEKTKEVKYISSRCGVEFLGFREMDTHN